MYEKIALKRKKINACKKKKTNAYKVKKKLHKNDRKRGCIFFFFT